MELGPLYSIYIFTFLVGIWFVTLAVNSILFKSFGPQTNWDLEEIEFIFMRFWLSGIESEQMRRLYWRNILNLRTFNRFRSVHAIYKKGGPLMAILFNLRGRHFPDAARLRPLCFIQFFEKRKPGFFYLRAGPRYSFRQKLRFLLNWAFRRPPMSELPEIRFPISHVCCGGAAGTFAADSPYPRGPEFRPGTLYLGIEPWVGILPNFLLESCLRHELAHSVQEMACKGLSRLHVPVPVGRGLGILACTLWARFRNTVRRAGYEVTANAYGGPALFIFFLALLFWPLLVKAIQSSIP